MGQLQLLDKMLALVLRVEERLAPQPSGRTTTLEASSAARRQSQEGCLVRLRSISQPPPPQVLALGLGHQLGRRTACLAPPAPVEGSSHPKAMPSRRTSLLASETLEQVPAVAVSLEPPTPLPILLGVHLALSLAQLVSLLLQLAQPLSSIHQQVQILW